MSQSPQFVSVVAIVRNDPGIEEFVRAAFEVLAENYTDYELLLVDDGSVDNTADKIDELLDRYECLRSIRLSREFGPDVAATAGLDSAIGDYVAVMLAACDPPSAIPQMVERAVVGADIVIGSCRRRAYESWQLRWGRRLFFRLCNRMMDGRWPEDMASMRLFSRRALNSLTKIRQKTVHQRLISCSLGFRTEFVEYQQQLRCGSYRQRTLLTAGCEAVSILIANSRFPLRLVSYLGVLAATLNLLYMMYVVAINVFKRQVAEGWTTLSLQMAVMFLFLFSTLVVISEYLAHTLEEAKDRPLYHVADEKSSSTARTDERKRNVRVHIPASDRLAA